MTAFSTVGTPSRPRVAVLIDGDHIPPSFRTTALLEAGSLGEVVSTQLFCDLSLRTDWAAETGLDVVHCKGRPGKNSTDMALCIAALDMAYRNLARAFVIASNDRDFEPLVRHLQRIGFVAVQVRQSDTPASPPVPETKAQSAKPPVPPSAGAKPANLVAVVSAHIRAHGSDKGLPLADLNRLYKTLGFKVSETTEKSWRAWLKARPQHFSCDPKGPDARVRLVSPAKGPAVSPLPHTAP